MVGEQLIVAVGIWLTAALASQAMRRTMSRGGGSQSNGWRPLVTREQARRI